MYMTDGQFNFVRKVLGLLSLLVSLRKLGILHRKLYIVTLQLPFMNTYAWRPPADHRAQELRIRDCGHFRKTPVVAPVPVIHIVLTKRITASGNDKRHGFSRLTVVYMLYYMLHACATYVMPLLFSLSTRRLRISCSIF